MMRHLLITTLGILLLLSVHTSPATAGAYGTELPFVLGTNARVSGMGAAGVSLLGDASIQYYNPAALSRLEWKQFAFFRSTLFESSSLYHTLSYAHPLLNHGTLALSVMRVDVGQVEERDDTNQLLSEDLHNSQTRVLLGYGRPIGGKFAAGFNVVFDNQSFGSYSGSGIGLDVGLSAEQIFSGRSMIKGLRQGFTVHNLIEPSVKLDQEKVADPANIGLGLSVLSAVHNLGMVTTIDLVRPRFSPVSLRFGQEFSYQGNFALRFGVDDTSPTFGFGAHYKSMALDYAFQSEDFGNNHRFSLSVRFGPSVGERRSAERMRREQEINSTLATRMNDLEQSHIDQSMAEGKRLFGIGQYEEAAEQLDIVLLWDPNNDEARDLLLKSRYESAISLGRSALDGQDYGNALVHFSNALSLVPNDKTAQSLVDVCEKRIATARNSTAIREQLLKTAIDMYAERRFVDALVGFDEVLKLAPDNSLAREYRHKCEVSISGLIERHILDARALADKQDFQGAIRILERTLAYDNNNAVLRADIDRYRSLDEAAQVAMEQPRDLEAPSTMPSQPVQPPMNLPFLEGQYNEGLESFNRGDFNKAIASLSEVWGQAPGFHNVSTLLAQAYLFVGMNYYSEQNYDEAIRMWERALTVDPDNRKVKRYLSKATEEMSRLGLLGNR